MPNEVGGPTRLVSEHPGLPCYGCLSPKNSIKRRVARQPVAQDSDPTAPPVEVKLTPEQEAVLGRMREFLGSTRSVPMRS